MGCNCSKLPQQNVFQPSMEEKKQDGGESIDTDPTDDSLIFGLEDLLGWGTEKKTIGFKAMKQILISIDEAAAKLVEADEKCGVVYFSNCADGLKKIIHFLGADERTSQIAPSERTPYQLTNIEGRDFHFVIPPYIGDEVKELNLVNPVVTADILKKFSCVKFVFALTLQCLFDARGKWLYETFNMLKKLIGANNDNNFDWLSKSIQFLVLTDQHSLTDDERNTAKAILNDVYFSTFASSDNSEKQPLFLQYSDQVESDNFQQLIDNLSFKSCSEIEFFSSLSPDAFSYLSNTLVKKLTEQLNEALKDTNLITVKDIVETVLNFEAKYRGDEQVGFVVKEMVLNQIISHLMGLKQAFTYACLPSHQWSEEKIDRCFGTIKEFQEGLLDFKEARFPQEDLSELKEKKNESKQLQKVFKESRNEQEDAVVNALLEVKEILDKAFTDNGPSEGERDVESKFQKAEEEVGKLGEKDKKRYDAIIKQYRKTLDEQELRRKDLLEKQKKLKKNAKDSAVVHEKNEKIQSNTTLKIGPSTNDTVASGLDQKLDDLRKRIDEITTITPVKERVEILKACITLAKEKAKFIKDHEMIVLLGNTGAGKSTLINVLCGKKVIEINGRFEVEDGEENSVAKIGHGSTSETLFPDLIEGDGNQIFCDCPGFFDTRGIEPNLGNAVSLYEAFKGAGKIRMIVLTNYYTLTSPSVADLDAIFNSCSQLFGSDEDLLMNANKLILGISHVPKSVDEDEIKELVKKCSHEVVRLLSENTFLNNPANPQLQADVNNAIEKVDWIDTKELKCKANIVPTDEQGLLSMISQLLVEFEKQIKEGEYHKASSSANNLTSVLSLVDSDLARELKKKFKEAGETCVSGLIDKLEQSYLDKSKSFEETSASLMRSIETILKEILPDEKLRKIKEKYDAQRKEREIDRFYQDVRQCDAAAKELMNSGDAEMKSLSALFVGTCGRKWFHNTNWIVRRDKGEIGGWKGVTCNNEGRVIKIELPNNNLSGMLDEKVFEAFELLEELDLSGNDIYGELPSSLYKLKNLTKVSLKGNKQLCGPPPPEHLKPIINCEQTLVGLDAINLDFSTFGFYVVPKENFEKMDRFITHESAMEKNMLVLLTTVEKFCEWTVKQNRQNNEDEDNTAETASKDEEEKKVKRDQILFLSHRWRGSQHPDCVQNSKLNQLKDLLKMEEFAKVDYVWMDYLCVPQADNSESKEKQLRAIQSLPHYVKCCNHFVVLTCDKEVHEEGTFDVYMSRGWCRLERYSAMIPVANDSNQEIVTAVKQHHTKKSESKDELEAIENKGINPEEISPVHGIFFDKNDLFEVISLFPKINDAIQGISQDEKLKDTAQKIFADADKYLDYFPFDVEWFDFIAEADNQDEAQLASIIQNAVPGVNVESILKLLKTSETEV